MMNYDGRPSDISKPRWRAITGQVRSSTQECRTTGTGNCRCPVRACLLGYPDTVAAEEKKKREDRPEPESLPKGSPFEDI